MPDSMYDKLGELLSEAIESGNFFYEKEHSSLNIEQKSYEEEREKKICIDSVQWKNKKKPYEKNSHKAFYVILNQRIYCDHRQLLLNSLGYLSKRFSNLTGFNCVTVTSHIFIQASA